jgi:peptide/nickel transport system permease protein
MIGALVLAITLLAAVTAHYVAPYDPNQQALEDRLLPPSWAEGGVPEHLLGTDPLGRDILSRLIHGSRVSLLVGLLGVLVSGSFGLLLGLVAGYFGGWVDVLVMRLVDTLLAFPFMLLAIAVAAVLGPGLRNVVIILGISQWMAYARITRGQVLSLKEEEFVLAARSMGVSGRRILLRHILPNSVQPVIVIATFAMANNIILEASLTFLGVGVKTSVTTWGSMLSEGRNYVGVAWWLTTFPGVAIMLVVLSVNMIGDWIRERTDPRLRGA